MKMNEVITKLKTRLDVVTNSPNMYCKYDMKASEENMHVDVWAERVKQVVTRYIFVR